jgi:transcriptional repressor NrdR
VDNYTPFYKIEDFFLMKCPSCGHPKDKVIDSRTCRDGQAIRRRRSCLHCKRRYTTYEYIETALMVVKKDGRREAFDRQKILAGLRKACEKRPISIDVIERAVESIENELQGQGAGEVHSTIIGEMVMRTLQELDGVAYVRFASVYRSFREVAEFTEAAKRFAEKTPKKQIQHTGEDHESER